MASEILESLLNEKIKVTAVNPYQVLLQDSGIESIVNGLETLEDIISAQKAIEKAKAIFADIQRGVQLGLSAFAALQAIVDQLVSITLDLFEVSFHMLEVTPKPGGIITFLNRLNSNLHDPADEDRPYDEGGSFLQTNLFLISSNDLSDAWNSFDNLQKPFSAAKALRSDLLKTVLGVEDFESLKQAFWGHYVKKEQAGSHQSDDLFWIKKSTKELFPSEFLALTEQLQNYIDQGTPNINAISIANRIDSVFNYTLNLLQDIQAIYETWKSFIVDAQITIIALPVVQGSSEGPGQVQSAVKNLSKYLSTIYGQIKDKTYEDGTGGQDISSILRNNVVMAGLVIVFKGPSTNALTSQSEAFLRLFGII